MALKLYKELSLDVNEVRVVWRATVMVYDPARDEDGCIELWECPFAIDREVQAQEWIEERAAMCRQRYAELQQ